jgi:hypothetical protein
MPRYCLRPAASPNAPGFDPMGWVPVSGRLGPGNPILAFRMDRSGGLRRLIKLARYADADHLPQEAQKLQLIEKALGPELATRVIRPTASTRIDGRATLAYDYVPTFAFFGLRWRVQRRRRFCQAMTEWLATVALVTRREDGRATAGRLHRAPLRRLIERGILPPAMQAEASLALAWLDAQATLPTVFEHGDLGIYNTRMTRAAGSDFRVLDWGSSTFDGIALGDLAYLLSSARAPGKLGASCLRQYLQRLDLPEDAAAPLWFAYLARRWAELDTVRAPVEGDPESGGGVLLAIHAQVRPYLDRLADAGEQENRPFLPLPLAGESAAPPPSPPPKWGREICRRAGAMTVNVKIHARALQFGSWAVLSMLVAFAAGHWHRMAA